MRGWDSFRLIVKMIGCGNPSSDYQIIGDPVWYTICEFAMRGIEDPLLVWILEDSSAKDVLIEELRAEIRNMHAENRTLYDWFEQAQERFSTYARMIRTARNRIWHLERRLIELGEEEDLPGSPIAPFEVINLHSDSDTDVAMSDDEVVEYNGVQL